MFRSSHCSVASHQCVCLFSLPNTTDSEDRDRLCDQRCSVGEIEAPCGSANTSSVYRTQGPYILSAEFSDLPVTTQVNANLSLALTVTIATNPWMELGFDVEGSSAENRSQVLIVSSVTQCCDGNQTAMSVGREIVAFRENDTTTTSLHQNVLIQVFKEPGTYVIDLEVSNFLSSVHQKASISVIMPTPSGLQITLTNQNAALPACVPSDLKVADSLKVTESVSVFVNQEVEFMAKLSSGINVTFYWLFEGNNSDHVTLAERTEICAEEMCYENSQKFTFEEAGEYEVKVQASNDLGKVTSVLPVVVVPSGIRNLQIQLQNQSSELTILGKPTDFLIALETAHRGIIVLELHVDENVTIVFELNVPDNKSGAVFSIRDQTIKEGKAANTHIELLSNTDTCVYEILISHVFTNQGSYNVSVKAYSRDEGNSSAIQASGPVVMVQPQLANVGIICPMAVEVGSQVTCTVTIGRGHESVMWYHWTIWHKENEDMDLNHVTDFTTSEEALSYTPERTGLYELCLKTSNNVSNVSASKQISVQIPISGAKVEILVPTSYNVATGNLVSIEASVDDGSHVLFKWNPFNQDLPTPQISSGLNSPNGRSIANYTFTKVTEYNITVEISNELKTFFVSLPKKISVQEEITGLKISVAKAVAKGEVTSLNLSVVTGSPLRFEIDDGSGREQANQVVKERGLVAMRTFNSVGIHQIIVYVENEVSRAQKQVEIEVQDKVPTLTLHQVSSVLVRDEHTTWVLKHAGRWAQLQDVVYQWSVNGEIVSYSDTPLLSHRFLQTGSYNITVVTYNLVSRVTQSIQNAAVVNSSNRTRFNMKIFNPFGSKTQFKILELVPLFPIEIQVNYGDERSNSVNVEESADRTKSWEGSYDKKGVYKISASCIPNENDTLKQDLVTYVCTQDPIKGLSIRGKVNIKVTSEPVVYNWTVDKTAGSHVLYNWTFNGNQLPISTKNQYKTELQSAGIYTLSVLAFNSVSNSSDSLTISVIHPISHITIVTHPVILGNITHVIVTVDGGREFNLKIDFGDGKENSSRIISSQGEDKTMVTTTEKVLYNFTINYEYSQIGEYMISVNVTNPVSWAFGMSRAYIEEPISGVDLKNLTPLTLELGQTAVVMATVNTGMHLQFHWDFNTSDTVADIVSQGKNSTATLNFPRPGEYTISLSVTNPLYPGFVVCEKPIVLKIVEPITGLQFYETDYKDAAELFQVADNGGSRTEEVTFVAQVKTGSNVKFLFDFGDSTPVTVAGKKEEGVVKATSSHVFTRADKYRLSVKAFNDLSEMSRNFTGFFYVQERPDISLSQKSYTKELGKELVLDVSVKSGHNLKFDWFMGDTKEYRDNGARVTHVYETAKRFNLKVEAYNKVGRDEFTATVNVIERILAVYVEIDQPVHILAEMVTMVARLEPDKPIAQWYKWDFGAKDAVITGSLHSSCHGNSMDEVCRFRDKGRYNVTVTAGNDLGRVTSDPVEVHVVEQIQSFMLTVYNEALINTNISFEAYSYSGSDVSYTWVITNLITMVTELNLTKYEDNWLTYNFTEIGRYDITVTGDNPVSHMTSSMTMFILDRVCKQPRLKMLQVDKNGKKFSRSEYIKIEVDVKINCSISKATNYKWEIYNALNGQKEDFPDLSPRLFQDRILYLPPRTLEYGTYYVLLEVEMRNTPIRVFTPQNVTLEIGRSALQSVIMGGIKRKVSREETLVMDGSKSHDPDYTQTQNLTYTWSCKDLNQSVASSGCFHHQVAEYLRPQPILHIPASDFVESSAEFEFVLEVCKEGRVCGTAEQVIKVERQKLLDVNLECTECEDGLVNSDRRLVVEATHPGYQEDDLQYTWQLEVVGASIPDPEEEVSRCQSRGTVLQNLQAPSPAPSTLSPTTRSTTPLPTTTTTTVASVGHGGLLGGLSEGEDEDCSSMFGCEEDFEGEVLEERDEEQVPDRGPAPSSGDQGNQGNQDDQKDPATDALDAPKEAPHVLSQERSVRPLQEMDTVTGLGKRVLVIRPGVLTQNKSFIIGVTVSHANDSLEGSALAYFRVNRSPYSGQCSLWPGQGTEMQTDFSVFCQGWKDEHSPLRYEVSFSVHPDDPQDVVYRGLNHQVTFRLPAGLPQHNHQLNISVHVSDNLGSRTRVCESSVEVLPQSYNTSQQTEEEILYELVQENNSSLADYVQEGDNRNARLHAQMVATRLNRLNQSEESEGETEEEVVAGGGGMLGIRQKIRRAVLWALKDMPLRDEYEIQQTTTAVVLTTEKTQELSEDSLRFATSILHNAGRQTSELVSSGLPPPPSLTAVAVQGTSNILGAVHRSAERITRQGVKEIVERSNKVIHSVLSVDTSTLVSGEEPIKKQYDNVFVMASRHKLNEAIPQFHTQSADFTVPQSIGEIIKRSKVKENEVDGVKDACFQSHVINYRHNPFVYAQDSTVKVKTQVAALSLLTCAGEELELSNLAFNEEFHINLQHDITQNERSSLEQTYTLRKEQINYHQFNLSGASETNTLNIDIDLDPVKEGRLFPLVILIRQDVPPSPDQYDLRFDFALGQDEIRVTLQPGALNASAQYHLAVSDAGFDAGKPRQGEVRERRYRLTVWHASCRFWNTSEDRWSVEGCHMVSTSTFQQASCRCNHLTSFAASFNLEPNDLNFKNIEDFFDLHENPVTFALIACLLTVYLLLLVICVRRDNQDKTRGAPIYLIDNSAADRQKYILTLETGFRKNAGTSAKVSIVLHGDEGMSETRELISQSEGSLFERNSRNKFILTLPTSLGPIYKIQLWHNNAGPKPGWFLSRVTIKDVNSGQGFYFSCEKWFAVDRDDGKVEKEFNAIEGGLGFSHVLWSKDTQYFVDFIFQVLWSKGTQYFVDHHLWFSTLTRPPYSRFTRAQRLTCCLALVTSYMAVSATWYRQTEEEFRGEFGLIDVSWRAVIVGVLTSVLVLPPNCLIVWLFRRSRAKRPGIIDEPAEQRRMSDRRDSTSTMDSTSRLLHPVHTPSIFDQSILNWQGLQEWAQKTWAKRYRSSPSGSTQSVQPPVQTLHMSEEMERRAEEERARVQLAAYTRNRGSDPPSQRSSGSYGRPPHMPLTGRLSDRDSSHGTSCTSEGATISEKDILLSMRSQKPGRCFVPGFFRYFAWFLSSVVIVGCAGVTVLYGFRFGRVKSLLWLQSLFFSVMQCVFITHPLLILLMSLYIAVKYRNDMSIFDHHDDGLTAEKDAEHKECEIVSLKSKKYNGEINLSEGIAARQRSRYLRFSRPPHEKTLLKSRNQTIREHKASIVLSETWVFVFIFVILSLMAFGKSPTPGYQLTQSLTTRFVETGSPAYKDIKDVPDLWAWLQTDFMEALYSDTDKTDTRRKRSLNKVFTSNCHLVGEVHMRQHRVFDQRCHLHAEFPLLTPEICRYPYTQINRDRWPYGTNGSWLYFEQSQTGSHKMTGRQGHYGGDGFLVMLSRDRSEAVSHLSDLEQENWIDKYSRAVVIEFTLFHPASHLFSSVTLLLERPAVGQMIPLHRITTATLYKYISVLDNIRLAAELLFVVALLLKLKSVLTLALWQQKEFLRSFWNVLDVLFCTVGLAFCGCFVYRFVVVSETVELVRATYREDFVDMAPLAFWDQMLRTLVGVLYFITILQTIKILRHRKPFAAVGNVLKHASLDIFVLFLVFCVWLAAFSCLSIALYGSLSYRLHTLDSAILSITGLYTQHYPFSHLETGSASSILGWRLLVASFLVFALGSMTAYTVAVLSFHYKVYRDDPHLVLDVTDTLRYYWQQLLQWSGLKPFQFPPEEDKLPTECTIAELNYQVDEMLFKINALAGTANLPEKPHIQTLFTDSDTTYGSGGPDIDNNLYIDGVKNVEFWSHGSHGKFQQRVKKIEDNLLFQEPHLAQLLVLENLNRDQLAIDLRNQLELEIFRQLQSGRHVGDLSGVGSDTYPSSLSYQGPPSTNCYQGSASQSQTGSESSRHSGMQDSGRGSPSAKEDSGEAEKNTKKKVKVTEAMEQQEEENKNNRNLYPRVTIASAPDATEDTDVNKKPPKSPQTSPHKTLVSPTQKSPATESHPSDEIPMVDMGANSKADQSNAENHNTVGPLGKGLLPQNVVNLQNSGSSDAVGSSTSSGAREVRSVLAKDAPKNTCSHGNPLKKAANEKEEKDLGGKKSTDVVAHMKPKTAALVQKSPKTKKPSTKEAVVFTYENSIYDTSDSDLSDESSAKSSQPRSLRKTKSRGKGKGQRSDLTPIGVGLGLDELGFTNEGYIGEKNKAAGHHRGKKKKTTRA